MKFLPHEMLDIPANPALQDMMPISICNTVIAPNLFAFSVIQERHRTGYEIMTVYNDNQKLVDVNPYEPGEFEYLLFEYVREGEDVFRFGECHLPAVESFCQNLSVWQTPVPEYMQHLDTYKSRDAVECFYISHYLIQEQDASIIAYAANNRKLFSKNKKSCLKKMIFEDKFALLEQMINKELFTISEVDLYLQQAKTSMIYFKFAEAVDRAELHFKIQNANNPRKTHKL